ncbi:MAG: hypothetical protein DCC75_08380 [Proteobacteria bacterium]|nr:MAG: hypothetical protein DCC75_08380 [Pseudomonadota bacterium]
MMRCKQRGLSLLAILVISAAFFGVVSALWLHIEGLSNQRASQIYSDRVRARVKNRLIAKLATPPGANSSRLTERVEEELSNKVAISRSIITRVYRPDQSILSQSIIERARTGEGRFPRFNYGKIFGTPSACALTPAASAATGREFAAESDCILQSLRLQANSSFLANLSAHQIASLRAPDDAPITLAVLGYLRVPGTLRTESDLILVAGGRIEIESLQAPTGTRITVISARGPVTISTVQGAPKLQIIAHSQIQAPQLPPRVSRQLLPPLLLEEVIGFRAVE